ncbi:hypothetical protein Metal_0333 [Methylomicrobium album BG8]|uniref:Uncharacterized protein n=1 Tax=Methylomicrobium album BG8 TaxID=686340 RepID=H8GLZ6_METAL|nr:hypothetical protein Metal_0333 [Methylomicrobium album BG8]
MISNGYVPYLFFKFYLETNRFNSELPYPEA